MAESVSQDEVHQEGTEYIKDTLEQRHETQGIPEGTTAAPAPKETFGPRLNRSGRDEINGCD
ncbi:Hypothetical predicted protein [Lecanosticta acicola]|uniref:Uncharacterized protein n=1 Tax=Lecanosticta acicola TaxID=111012 RepID=A0AAI8Z7Z0_9PEZI|nr:Hypothetical predicted protein [Lecanosticta acicola]